MIKEKRKELDIIDENIMELLSKRYKITDEIMKIKKENNISYLDSGREKIILERAKSYDNDIVNIYKIIMELSKKRGK